MQSTAVSSELFEKPASASRERASRWERIRGASEPALRAQCEKTICATSRAGSAAHLAAMPPRKTKSEYRRTISRRPPRIIRGVLAQKVRRSVCIYYLMPPKKIDKFRFGRRPAIMTLKRGIAYGGWGRFKTTRLRKSFRAAGMD